MTAVLSPAVPVLFVEPIPTRRPTRESMPCPTCGTQLGGDVVACGRTACIAADIAADAAQTRAGDL